MKKALTIFLSLTLSVTTLFSAAACGGNVHNHDYSAVSAKSATCTDSGNISYYECSCGKYFIKNGDKYEEKSIEELTITAKGHVFDKEIEQEEFLAAEATDTIARKYFYSCECGLSSKDENKMFSVGKSLSEYANEDKNDYVPNSLTITLYDAENCVYGFTWNTKAEPARSVVRICEGKAFADYIKTGARTENAFSYEYGDPIDKQIDYHISKAEIKLKPNTEYTYTVGDEYLNTSTEEVTIKTVNPKETRKWRFAHVSDSQAEGDGKTGIGTGKSFGKVLKCVTSREDNRFLLHTGDVVEYSMYESYWRAMLGENFAYLSKLPIMAISGNHETTYKSGEYETYKHFDYKIPEQEYIDLGFYYSFSYGGVKFIMLNTNRLYGGETLTSDQYSWLESELKNKTEKWTIVAMHNPMYSVGKWGSDPAKNSISRALTAQLGELFATYNVDLVLQGHDHMVSRTHPITAEVKPAAETKVEKAGVEYTVNPEGVIYVMNGPAGDQSKGDSTYLYDKNLYEYAEGSESCSWAEFEITANSITVYVKYVNAGSAKTSHIWGIEKTA